MEAKKEDKNDNKDVVKDKDNDKKQDNQTGGENKEAIGGRRGQPRKVGKKV